MKKIMIIFMVGLLTPLITQAQGVVYLSNLDQSFSNSNPVGSNSWLAVGIGTGNNPSGYLLDSIQLGMTNAIGNPNGFSVMIYSAGGAASIVPQTNLCTLSGSLNPIIADIYAYTPTNNLILSPNTLYYLVLAAGTTVANGAYEWNYSNTQSYNPNGGWLGAGTTLFSNNGGSSWARLGSYPNYDYSAVAITATPVPEPSPSWLLLLGSGVFIYVRRIFKS